MLPGERFILTPRVAIAAGCLLLVSAVIYGVTTWHTLKQEKIERLQTALSLTSKALNNHLAQQEASLHGLALALTDGPGLDDRTHAEAVLARYQSLHDDLTSIHLLAPDGKVLASASTPERAALPAVTRVRAGGSFAAFLESVTPSTTMDLGRPLKAPIAQRWYFPTRYVLRGADGAPRAFLSTAVPVELTERFWRDTPLVSRAALGLIRADGYLISLHPVPPGASLDAIYGSPRHGTLFKALSNGIPRYGHTEGLSSTLNQHAIYLYERLERHPAAVFVVMPLAELGQIWWRTVRVPLLLTILLAALGWIGARHVLARRAAWSAWAVERQRADAALAEKHVAEEASRAKNAVMARMSHELRTPLNAILGFAQLLQRDAPDNLRAEQRTALDHVAAAGQRLLTLVDDLLQVSYEQTATSASNASDPPPAATGTHDLLYIDDDEVNRHLMEAYLGARPSLRLHLAVSGAEGLAIARATRPALVMIDLMMPDMDGIAVLRALRAEPTLGAIPCIAVSANALPDQIDAALAAGFDGYLVKPVAREVLLQEVDRHLANTA